MHWAVAYAMFAVVCVVLAFKLHPIYALFFYLSTTYVHPPSRWWAQHLPDLRWAVVAAAICVLAVLFHRGKLSPRPPFAANAPVVILCLYGAWMWLQTPWALDLDEHLSGSTTFTKHLLAMWFVYRIADRKQAIRDVLLVHAAGCAGLGIIARFFEERVDGRVEGVGGPGIDDANSLGMFLCTGAVACLALALSQRGWRRWAALVMLPATIVGLTMTSSRGAFLGLLAGMLVLLFAHPRAYRASVLSVGVLALLAGGVIVLRDQAFRDRIATIGDVAAATDDQEADMSARSRAAIKDAQIRMAQDYPMGVGHRGVVPLSRLYMESVWLVTQGRDPNAGRSSHNTFLTALVEQGVIGAALFLALVGWLLVAIWRMRRLGRGGRDPELVMLGAGLCAGLTVVMVAGLATDYLLMEVQFWFFALLVSGMHALQPVAPAADARRGVAAPQSARPEVWHPEGQRDGA